MELPDGLTGRPLQLSDARAVFEVMAAQELCDVGTVEIEEADIVSDWSRPSHDVSANSVGVFDADRLVAYVEAMDHGRGDAAVHPDYRGRGLGTALALKMQDLARAIGSTVVGMPVPEGSPGDRLLAGMGYFVRWHSWVLELPPGNEVPTRDLPTGFTVGVATPTQVPEIWTVVEDAFLEWSVRDRELFEDFEASVVGRPGFEPWHLRVAVGPDGAVVGAAALSLSDQGTVYISRLAVRRDCRRRGLAQALLVDAFAAGREHGATGFELSTDSRTGALGLYERVGMRVRDNWVHRAIDL